MQSIISMQCEQGSVTQSMTDTSIRISKENKDALARLGDKGDTYDEIISRLLQENDYMKFVGGELDE